MLVHLRSDDQIKRSYLGIIVVKIVEVAVLLQPRNRIVANVVAHVPPFPASVFRLESLVERSFNVRAKVKYESVLQREQSVIESSPGTPHGFRPYALLSGLNLMVGLLVRRAHYNTSS